MSGARICKHLKVHKIKNFFGFDFEICTISLLVCQNFKILQKNVFVCAIIVGVTIIPRSPRTTQNEKKILREVKIFFGFFH
jgi:hypothetical protein